MQLDSKSFLRLQSQQATPETVHTTHRTVLQVVLLQIDLLMQNKKLVEIEITEIIIEKEEKRKKERNERKE